VTKGIKIERATPGNILDVYALYKLALEENDLVQRYWKLSRPQMQQFYFQVLEWLGDPMHIIMLARRGKSYWGVMHGILAPSTFRPGQYLLNIPTAFILKDRRKLGIGAGLAEAMEEEAQRLGVSHITLLCKDELVSKWTKHGAKRELNYLIKEL
jgi:GNAT superfamily N-acetyltransferase